MNGRLACTVAVSAVTLVLLAGCGGGGGPAATDEPVGPAETVHKFKIDFENDTVTVIEEAVIGTAMVDADPGGASPELGLTLTLRASDTGSPGRRHVDARVSNYSTGTIGANRDGVVTGVDLVFTSLEFQTRSGAPVPGGGVAGANHYNALTGLPVFRLEERVRRGQNSRLCKIDFLLPLRAATAVVGIIIRCDTERNNTPKPMQRYLTTVAGRPGYSGYIDGPAAVARFDSPHGVHYREHVGDILVADAENDVVRSVRDGQVTTLVAANLLGSHAGPFGVAEDAEGNVVVGLGGHYQIYLASPDGSTGGVIAGTGTSGSADGPGSTATFDRPWGIAVVGNDIYVAETYNKDVRKVHFNGGNRFFASNYTVSTVWTDDSYLYDVAVDALGSLYLADGGDDQISIIPRDTATAYVIAGTGTYGSADGRGDVAQFSSPWAVSVDAEGTVYVAEQGRNLRKVRYAGGDITDPTSYYVGTVAQDTASAQDGARDAGTLGDLTWVTTSQDGTLWLADDDAIRRLDRRVH